MYSSREQTDSDGHFEMAMYGIMECGHIVTVVYSQKVIMWTV